MLVFCRGPEDLLSAFVMLIEEALSGVHRVVNLARMSAILARMVTVQAGSPFVTLPLVSQ